MGHWPAAVKGEYFRAWWVSWGMKSLVLVLLLTGCVPYYGSIVYDIETTVACGTCPEANPVVPDTKNRLILYGYSALYASVFTYFVEKTDKETLFYTIATVAHLLAGTLNLRYVKY